MSAIEDDNDHAIPTEEIYLELQELKEAAAEQAEEAADEPSPVTHEDDPSGIKARIARLRAMLSDRGAPLDD